MNSNYERVLSAVRQVTEEAKHWMSRDGESLAEWSERRTMMAADRLTQILFPEEQCNCQTCEDVWRGNE